MGGGDGDTGRGERGGGHRELGRAADVDGDGHDDLAIGAPGAAVRGKNGAGYVGLAFGWKAGVHVAMDGDGHADLVVSDTQADDSDGFHDAGAIVVAPKGVVGVAERGDRFGSTLALGDYDGDGTTDVAVGAPGKWKGAGAVGVLYGGGHGLSADRSILFGPDSLCADEAGASFGAALGG